jgi:hypothetical protein
MCWGGFADCSLDIAIDLGTHNLPQDKEMPSFDFKFSRGFSCNELNSSTLC